MSSVSYQSKVEQIKKEEEKRRKEILVDFYNDPYLGYSSIEEALQEYKCTTQAEVMARLLNRENVFISGPAGSGKTTLIKKFIDIMDAQFNGHFTTALTASTGIAATLIDGITIHSWAGLGISTEPFNPKKIEPSQASRFHQIRATDILIIDEISMLPAYIFDKLDALLKYVRRNKEPFGGLQVILMGDFLQLPPVDRKEEGVDAGFVAKTKAWKELELSYCYMDKVHRAADPKLVNLLAKMSRDKVDNQAKELVNSRISAAKKPSTTYTTLFTTNRNVDKYNLEQQALNSNPLVKLKILTSGPAKEVAKIIKNSAIAEELFLKVGDTVILTSNIKVSSNSGGFLANGSIGKITSFTKEGSPQVLFNNGERVIIDRKDYIAKEKVSFVNKLTGKEEFFYKEIATARQFPLKLGYAITVHKSQGQTFDGVVADLSKCFTPGLGYVALSRVKSLDDLIIEGISDSAYKVDPKSKALSNYVKRKALKGRHEFIENMGDYETILTSEIFRLALWPIEEAARNQTYARRF